MSCRAVALWHVHPCQGQPFCITPACLAQWSLHEPPTHTCVTCPGAAELEEEDDDSRLLNLYGERLARLHAEDAPGEERESHTLKPNLLLQEQMSLLESRDDTYQCLLVTWARIFRRWREREEDLDSRDFRRGLAHMLVLSCPGSGGLH